MKRVLSLILVCVLLVCMLPLTVLAETAQTTPMYRLYNPNSGEHFYTGSVEEKDNLVAVGWNYEGIAWNAPVNGGDPVYRLYNPNSGDHHYTMSALEREMLVGFGWQYEGVCWNSVSAFDSTAVPLYRLYNPNADCGSHHYTTSVEERDNLVAVGWILEGIGWFGAGSDTHTHDYELTVVSVTCTTDGYMEYKCKGCEHSYLSEVIPALGHMWKDATCTEAKKCLVCGAEEGQALGHTFAEGKCTVCGEKDPDYVEESYVWIPTKGGTKYHATADCSNMENPEYVTLTNAKALGFTACKKCYGGDTETFGPISGGWRLKGLTDDESELDFVTVFFKENNAVEFYATFYGLIPDEYVEEALEFGYAETDEGYVYYNDIIEYNGKYYYWLGYGLQSIGTFKEEGNQIVVMLEGWDYEENDEFQKLTLERIDEETCQVVSMDEVIMDNIVTECIKNGKIFNKIEVIEEEW